MNPRYLTSKEVATLLRVSLPTLRKLMRDYGDTEDCPWLRFGNRYRWDADRLQGWFTYIDTCSELYHGTPTEMDN